MATNFRSMFLDLCYSLNPLCGVTQYVDSSQDAIKSNLDVLLKWVSLRFFDTNTSVLVKVLEFLRAAFTMLSAADYTLLDQEANSFIPYLVLKVRSSVFRIYSKFLLP